jgi:hypothetical protein
MDENLIRKTLQILKTEPIHETLLDELQIKVCFIFEICFQLIFNLKGF